MENLVRKKSEWNRDRYDWDDDRYYFSNENRQPRIPLKEAIAPLVDILKDYETLRMQLETQGGGVQLLEQLTLLLNKPIKIQTRWGASTACLANQKALREMICDVGRYEVHLDIRKLEHGLPVYYLFRKNEDHWYDYSLIVEDLYQSPGFPLIDERFVKMMRMGHEEYALRLSQFRPALIEAYAKTAKNDERWCDHILYQAGRYVFQAAWHDDQRPGFLTANAFDLIKFRQALELLYLCLSGELCELRSAVDDELLLFFDKVYQQLTIRQFMQKLIKLEGSEINDIPQTTLSLYGKLSQAFNRFLGTEVPWGIHNRTSPLFKLVFANINRLSMVSEKVKEKKSVSDAATQLERTAGDIIDCILA